MLNARLRECARVRASATRACRAYRCIDVRAMRYRDREGARWEEQEEEEEEEEDVDGGAMRRGESIERGRVGAMEREA